MDTSHTGELLKHLEKRNELLMDAYRSMMHELHKCQVEEEMLMQKFYELMSKHHSNGKNENGDVENNDSNALALATTTEVHIHQNGDVENNDSNSLALATTAEVHIPLNVEGGSVIRDCKNGDSGAIHSTSNDCLLLNNDDDVSDGGYDYYEDEEDGEDEHYSQ